VTGDIFETLNATVDRFMTNTPGKPPAKANALHWSDLHKIARSPAHYRYHMDSKGQPGVGEATPAMRFGSLVNYRALGATAHDTQFAVWTGEARRGKDWTEFKEFHSEKEIVTAAEWDTAGNVSDALYCHPAARGLLKAGVIEERLHWQVGDRDCAGTPDVLGPDVLVDLKVTNDASPDRFMWHAVRMGWLGQLAWYLDGAIASGHDRPKTCHIVAVEPKAPHVVTVFDLTDMAVEFGRCQWRALFEKLRACEESNCWPGYVATSTKLDAPDNDSFILDIQGEEVEVG